MASKTSTMIKLAREIRETADGGTPQELRDIVSEMIPQGRFKYPSSYDFNADLNGREYRFISGCYIDDALRMEFDTDPYNLGCFNAWFLAKYLPLTKEQILKAQKAECFEVIGQLVLACGRLNELLEDAVSYDDYGHFFSHYDGVKIDLETTDYMMFRTN